MFTSTNLKSCQARRRENCAHERQQLQSRLHKSGAPKLQIKAWGRNSRPGKIALQVTEIPRPLQWRNGRYKGVPSSCHKQLEGLQEAWKHIARTCYWKSGPFSQEAQFRQTRQFRKHTAHDKRLVQAGNHDTVSRVRWVVAVVAFPSKTSLPFGRTLTRVND